MILRSVSVLIHIAICSAVYIEDALLGSTRDYEHQEKSNDNSRAQQPLRSDGEDVTAQPTTPVHNASGTDKTISSYSALVGALHVMQDHFFSVAHATWPDAIDWTAAVMGTHVSATLSAVSGYIPAIHSEPSISEISDHENLINRYFTQLSTFYYGENAFSLRTQAYDDMLWVVLEWLEAIQFIKLHSSGYTADTSSTGSHNATTWYAQQFIAQFAHRARLFYDLASRGWDDTLCGGGMTWNPYLAPYKNAITNQLYIVSSISMYLYFPGDESDSPFVAQEARTDERPSARAHDQKYLHNAIKAYDWLKSSGMRNSQGLYVDGFHIRGWRRRISNGTGQCDLRSEMVYTYNQGVILTGLRGLWEATGHKQYLEEGHELIRVVIAATGWDGRDQPGHWRWAGLGRNGVLEDICDWSGTCSQDGQTFKGIFFHHFSIFCTPLLVRAGDGKRPWLAEGDVHALHWKECESYTEWVVRNSDAAVVTKDGNGEFGQWWGRKTYAWRHDDEGSDGEAKFERPSSEGADYRNFGVPGDDVWQLTGEDTAFYEQDLIRPENSSSRFREDSVTNPEKLVHGKDINDRGRGRTVETQSGGLSVVRAAWKLLQSSKRKNGQ